MLDVSKQIADWVYSNILISKEKASRDMDGLEKDYFSLRGKLKDKPSFAVLVNDIHNLPFDDLDWFQSVVLEALVSSPGSMENRRTFCRTSEDGASACGCGR